MTFKHKQNNNPTDTLEEIHQRGVIIAKKHITPYLRQLEKAHGYTQMEIAAALILLGYSAVQGAVKNKMKSLYIYAGLSKLSFFLLDHRNNSETRH